MKQAILLHGTGGSDAEYFWFEDTKKYLEEHGYAVWWPLLPNTRRPNREEALAFVLKDLPPVNEQTIIIGHSSACPLILSLLPELQVQIKQAILVAGFYQPIDDRGFSAAMLPKTGFDWEKIKPAAKKIILINSDNDPFRCDDKQARPVAEKLGAEFIFAEGEAHMGSMTFNQPYSEFPLLKRLLAVN